jgi:hypothetical protein
LGCGLEDTRFSSRQGKEILLFSKMSSLALRPTKPSIQGYRALSPGLISQDVNLTTHLQQAPRLRMSGAIPHLPLCAFMTSAGTNLLLLVHNKQLTLHDVQIHHMSNSSTHAPHTKKVVFNNMYS